MKHRDFLERIDKQAIVDAIGRAEARTSAEIRVHIQPRLTGGRDVLDTAVDVFSRLGMGATAERNGVLLFVASEDQQFTILGDQGIDQKTGHGFWDEIASALAQHFRQGEFTVGIVEAVERVGSALTEHFPRQAGDRNELSNEVSIDGS